MILRSISTAAAALLLSICMVAGVQAGEVLNRVVSSGKLRVAVMGSLPPYTNMKPDGEMEGYDIDLARKFAEALKVTPEFIVVDSAGRVAALQTGKADVTISGFARNVQRSLTIGFSDPYLIVPGRILVKTESPLQKVEDVNDPKYKLSLNRGGNSEPIIAAKFPNVQRMRFNTNADGLNALMSGQVDAMAQDAFYHAEQIAKHPGQLRMLEGSYSRQEDAIGVPAGDPDWLRVINLWLEQLNATGENKELFKKWFGFDPPKINADF
jgi:polar amino acid transport system substrate-binding protein